MHKVRIANGNHLIAGDVQVDEFVFGGKETLKQGCSTDSKKKKLIGAISETGKVKRAYFKRINDYLSVSLKIIFDEHIASEATVYTDKRTGYIPLQKGYNIIPQYSDNGQSMKQMHIVASIKIMVSLSIFMGR